jgi:DNA-binding Lrp family transcriptional regulator
MDSIDRDIVALLRANARRSYQDIGRHVALSAPAVKRRVDRLEASGVIAGYTAIIDPERFGWTTQAIIELHTDGRFAPSQVSEAIREHPEIVAAYSVAGAASAVLVVRTTDTRHLEQLLERLIETPAVTRTQTAVILSTLLERPFVNRAGSDGGSGVLF